MRRLVQRMSTLFVAFTAFFLLVGSSPAAAYNYTRMCGTQPARWEPGNPNATWRMSTAFLSADLTRADTDRELGLAFDEWAKPGCSEFNAQRGADTNINPMADNAIHALGFLETGWPAEFGDSAMAVTLTSTWNDCALAEADMVFNGVDFRWKIGTPNRWNDGDLRSVATHEVGHWLGMDHSSHAGSSLAASYSGGVIERSLTCDDTAGVCNSHRSGSKTCSSNDYCACNETCSGGTCVSGGGTTTSGQCNGPANTAAEVEPNDWNGDDDVNWFDQPGNGDFTVSGRITCGNDGSSYNADVDWFVIDYPCQDRAKFTLSWTGASDLDFAVWDTASNEAFVWNEEGGLSGPASAEANAGGRLFVRVLCWEGATTNYTFKTDWRPFSSTPSDSDSGPNDTSPNDTSPNDTSPNDTNFPVDSGVDTGEALPGLGWCATSPQAAGIFGLGLGLLALRRRRGAAA